MRWQALTAKPRLLLGLGLLGGSLQDVSHRGHITSRRRVMIGRLHSSLLIDGIDFILRDLGNERTAVVRLSLSHAATLAEQLRRPSR